MGRWIIALAAACCGLLGVAGTASAADVAVSGLVAKPIAYNGTCSTSPSATDAPAGSHRDYCVAFNVNTASDDVKKITIGLPAGVVGDPGAAARCPQATFEAGNCDAAAQVGEVSADATATLLVFPTDVTITGEVYNLATSPGEPARLGIALDQGLGGLTPVYLQSPIRVRVADAGLDSVTDNVPNTALGNPLHLRAMALTLWGTKVHHATMIKPFMSLPTRCDVDAVSNIAVTSYGGQTTSASTAFRPTGCDQLPFTPTLEVGPATTVADQPG